MNEKTPPRPPIVRPGAEPTHNDEQGGKRWHYSNLDGSKIDPCSFVYEHVSSGFGGECGHRIFPDGHFPAGSATSKDVRARIEHELTAQGFEVIDPPQWWAEAQMVRSALPKGTRLAGPIPGTPDPWLVCRQTIGGRGEGGTWAATPTAALRSATDSWIRHEQQETRKALDALHDMLREAGYSPDPAGLDEVLFQAGVRPGPSKPSDPGVIRAMTILEPAPMSFSVTLPDGTRIDVNKPAR